MPVKALEKNYEDKVTFRDSLDKFGGNMLVYTYWEDHSMFCAPMSWPLPAGMPAGALVQEVIAPHIAAHPDAAKIEWDKVEWILDDKKIDLDLTKSLEENGFEHKSLLRFITPGLTGYKGLGI